MNNSSQALVAKECSNRHHNPAADLEQKVWQEVCALHKEGLLTKVVQHTFDKRASSLKRKVNDQMAPLRLVARLQELTSMRSAYQDQQAAGLLTLDELRDKLSAIEDERTAIQGELDAINNAIAQITSLYVVRDTILKRIENGFFLGVPGPQERRDLYRQMGLRVDVDGSGNVTLSGTVLPADAFVSAWRGRGSWRP